MKKLGKIAIWSLIILSLLLVALAGLVWAITFHPAPTQSEPVTCPSSAPVLQPGQKLTVLSYNVQFMAGKNYVFFFDMPDWDGPDERPSTQDITLTLNEVARVIQAEAPDVILLQEMDDGARRTDYEDQLARLLALLPPEYACHTSAVYWKAAFAPHPRIMGAVGMKLSIISKYRITQATRHQLALIPTDPLMQQFNVKRAILEARLPVEGEKDLVVLDTHLDAFAQGSDTMQKQVAYTHNLLSGLSQAGHPWLIGGDFNLLPPGPQYTRLPEHQRVYYQPDSELAVLSDEYLSVPSVQDANGPDFAKWLTHYPNDPRVSGPDRTIDYIFYSDTLALVQGHIRQNDTQQISDHMPVIAEFKIPTP